MLTQDIINLLLHYRYLIMFFLMFLEGPIVGFISAFLAAQGLFDFWIVYILSISGDAFGDVLRYRVGRYVRSIGVSDPTQIQEETKLINRKAHRLSPITNWISRQIVNLEKKHFLKYLEENSKKKFFLTLLIVKITPPLSVPGQFSFGFLKIGFRRFLLQTTFVCFLFESIFLNLGYFSSISINTFKGNFDMVTGTITSICIGLVLLFVGFLIIKRIKNSIRKKVTTQNGSDFTIK